MSVFRIYPEKNNTIASGLFQEYNSGQNAVTELWYGGKGGIRNSISRYLVKFPLEELSGKFASGEIMSGSVSSYTLKMKNSIPRDVALEKEFEFDRLTKVISTSFDLITFPINKDWDEGRGYDLLKEDYVVRQQGNPQVSGFSNWNYATSTTTWDEPGVFANPTASTFSSIYSGSVSYLDVTFNKTDSLSPEVFSFSVLSSTTAASQSIIVVSGNNIDYTYNPLSGTPTTEEYISDLEGSAFSGLSIDILGGSSATTLIDQTFNLSSSTVSESLWSTQHFDIGDEDIEIDITRLVNAWINGEIENYGLAIAYRRDFELLSTDTRSISSFFTNKTNSAFKPYIEVKYDQTIIDDREQVSNNRTSRLFLYTFSGNSTANYYSASTVTIKGPTGNNVITGLTPTQLGKGVYYVDVNLPNATRGQRYSDVWQGVTFVPGMDQQDYVQYFTIKDNYYLGSSPGINDYTLNIYGLEGNSILTNEEVIRVFANVRVNYSHKDPDPFYSMSYRMIMNNQDEVIPWTTIHKTVRNKCQEQYFDLDTSWLLNNQTYKIEFRIEELGSKRILPNKIDFSVKRPF